MPVVGVAGVSAAARTDHLAVEEPLAIQITHGPAHDRRRATVSVTLRTPGHDEDLAAGLLLAEGVVTEPAQMLAVVAGRSENAVRVDLHPDVPVDLARLDRRGLTTSACGMCGKTVISDVEEMCDGPRPIREPLPAAVIHRLPDALRAAQPTFAHTGGLHAAGLFDLAGNLLAVREDVGRHNAVDKLIGAEFRAGRVPLRDRVLLVSGRAGFELIQKSAVAGVPVFVAVGAPSSLAVQLARRLGMALVGFVRDDRFNVYAGAEAIAL